MRKKEIVIQRDSKDCGVACLLSIIRHYGGDCSIEYLRVETLTSSSGTSAFHLVNVAKNIGFDAYGSKVNDLNKINNFPCIAHVCINGYNHFVVIYNISNNNVVMMDPAKGRVKLSRDKFNNIWRKTLLYFYPKTKIINYKINNNILDFIKTVIVQNKKLVSAIILSSLFITISSIFLNYYYEIAIDVINYRNFKSLYFLIFIFFFITVLKLINIYLREYYENYISKNIDFNLYETFIKHTLLIPLNIARTRSSGELMTRINEMDNVKLLITELLLTILLDLVLAIASMFLLYNISSSLFIILVIIIFLYIIISLILSKYLYPKIIDSINIETSFNKCVLDSIDNLDSLKNTNAVLFYFKKIKSNITEYLFNKFYIRKILNIHLIIKNIIIDIGMFIINSYAFLLIFNNKLELIDLITFNAFLIYLWNPIRNSIDVIPKYTYIKVSLSKLNDYLSIDKEELSNKTSILLDGDIEFKNISYSPNKFNLLLNKFSFKLENRSKVLFVGSSGSGKSSLCKMLNRSLKQDSGDIFIGGVNIYDYSLSDIRNNIIYNSQNESIFNDTLYNNITLYKKYSIKIIWEILHICELDNLVNKLPMRLETTINKDANNFSGGELQRIILARTLLLSRSVYILDESLSEVSQEQEERILNNIFSKFYDKLIIVISHKKVKVKFDQIIRIGVNE